MHVEYSMYAAAMKLKKRENLPDLWNSNHCESDFSNNKMWLVLQNVFDIRSQH